ncbi:MAG: SgcJ/EcaC family oxidoreductase [Ginsengibacter sp.]
MDIQINHDDKNNMHLLYKTLLESWNNQDAKKFANLFATDGNVIGFDGSQMNSRQQINDELSKIFSEHQVASYVGIVRDIRPLGSNVFLLSAVAGMVPPGKLAIKEDVNTIQTLIAQKGNDQIMISLFQNTPAAYHGRPQLSKKLTEELQRVFDDHQIARES